MGKIPKIKEGQADEKLIETGNKVDAYNEQRAEDIDHTFDNSPTQITKTFAENLMTLKKLFNDTVELFFDGENVIFQSEEVTV